jgi:hypothetical protein
MELVKYSALWLLNVATDDASCIQEQAFLEQGGFYPLYYRNAQEQLAGSITPAEFCGSQSNNCIY